ncbi:hypothetical protein FKP32DRAFT_1596937 [Trametes sanguinea]|nr:hypothetical protein FKP32DRAFT_1596937 [Trametes sanguinea]
MVSIEPQSGYSCEKCNKDFPSQLARTQHFVQSPRHAYCERCTLELPSFDQLTIHLRSTHHCCDLCRSGPPTLVNGAPRRLPRVFNDDAGLHAHRRRNHPDLYCTPCKRIFDFPSNLDSHRRSALHAGRPVVCPASQCSKRFVSLAALFIHLESGTCLSGVGLTTVSIAAVHADRTHVVTTDDAFDIVYGQSQAGFPYAKGQVEVEGGMYRCAVCDKRFPLLRSLTAHRRSPAHAEKIYRCPQGHGGCGACFRTLSSLYQHVESEKCGVRQNRAIVERAVKGVQKQLFSGVDASCE